MLLKRLRAKDKAARLRLRLRSRPLERKLRLDGADLVFRLHSREELNRIQAVTEPWTAEWVRALPEGAVLWDVGANIGIFTLLAARSASVAHVVAVEPAFLNVSSILTNAMRNGLSHKVSVLPVGLGAATALLPFNLQSLEPGGALHSFGAIAPIKTRPTDPAARVPCLCYRMDDLAALPGVPFPTHIKIDIDGGELDALAGAPSVLADPRLRALQVEAMDYDRSMSRRRQVVARLEAAGFRLAEVIEHPSKHPLVADLRFER